MYLAATYAVSRENWGVWTLEVTETLFGGWHWQASSIHYFRAYQLDSDMMTCRYNAEETYCMYPSSRVRGGGSPAETSHAGDRYIENSLGPGPVSRWCGIFPSFRALWLRSLKHHHRCPFSGCGSKLGVTSTAVWDAVDACWPLPLLLHEPWGQRIEGGKVQGLLAGQRVEAGKF